MTKTELEKLTTQNIIDAIRSAGDLFDSIAANTYHYRTSANKAERVDGRGLRILPNPFILFRFITKRYSSQ
jgi:hypothetical protein